MFEKIKKKSLIVITILVFGTMFLNIHTPKAKSQSENPKLTLEISVQKNTYIQLEPIHLKMKLLNNTNQAIKLHGLFILGQDLDFITQKAGSEEIVFDGRNISAGSVLTTPVTLLPENEVNSDMLVTNINQFEKMFPSTGTYQVRIKFRHKRFVGNDSYQDVVLSNQTAAWNKCNIEGFMQGYWNSEELSFTSGNKNTRGWQATFDNYKRSYPNCDKMGRLSFSELDIMVLSKKSAMVRGRFLL